MTAHDRALLKHAAALIAVTTALWLVLPFAARTLPGLVERWLS